MDILKTYNPGNKDITEEEISAMKDLTDEQIEQLAKAYPNQPRGNAYLEYYLTGEKPNEQRYPLGTWQNLNNLRKLGRKDVLPFRFRRNLQAAKPVQAIAPQVASKRVVDLSKQELDNAEGLKAPEVITSPVEATGSENTAIEPVVVNHVVTADDLASNPGLDEQVKEGDEIVIPSPELIAAEKNLQQAIDDKAHHMTIKSLQSKVDALKQAASDTENNTAK